MIIVTPKANLAQQCDDDDDVKDEWAFIIIFCFVDTVFLLPGDGNEVSDDKEDGGEDIEFVVASTLKDEVVLQAGDGKQLSSFDLVDVGLPLIWRQASLCLANFSLR